MARKMTPEKSREKTLKSLINATKNEKLTDKICADYIEQYMGFYDDLNELNDRIKTMKSADNFSISTFTAATAEKRRISNEMRNILAFLDVKPDGGGNDTEL